MKVFDMLQYVTLKVEIDGPVATIILNRPEKLNCMSLQLRDEFTEALDALEPGDAVRVIRLKGAGRAFCSGYDLEGGYDVMSTRQTLAPVDPDDRASKFGESHVSLDRHNLRQNALWLNSIRRYRKPIVAQIHGYAIAGGFELIGVCDNVFTADDCQIGMRASRALGVGTNLGLLPFKCGPQRTKEFLFTGDVVDGPEAERLNIVNRSMPADQLDDYVMAYCRRIAQVPLDLLTAQKEAVNRWGDNAGYHASIDAMIDLNSISHTSPFLGEFVRIAQTDSLKAALEWRDGGFDAAAPAVQSA